MTARGDRSDEPTAETFEGWTLARMRKYQATVNAQIPLAFQKRETEALERLQNRARAVTEAIMRAEFPDE